MTAYAAITLGIFSLILAAIATAPFVGCIGILGVPVALSGLVVGLVALVQLVRAAGIAPAAETAPPPADPDEPDDEDAPPRIRDACIGIGLSLFALVWLAIIGLVKGFVL